MNVCSTHNSQQFIFTLKFFFLFSLQKLLLISFFAFPSSLPATLSLSIYIYIYSFSSTFIFLMFSCCVYFPSFSFVALFFHCLRIFSFFLSFSSCFFVHLSVYFSLHELPFLSLTDCNNFYVIFCLSFNC